MTGNRRWARDFDLGSFVVSSPAEALLDQARDQLARQESTLDALRAIAGTVIAGGGVVVGFVAPDVASKQPYWSTAALLAFIVSVLAGVFVLTPKRLTFAEHLSSYAGWVSSHYRVPGADISFSLTLAENLECSRLENRRSVEFCATALRLQCALFGVEVVLWGVAALSK